MLIEFKVKNFRSIKDLQTMSLVADTATELEENTFQSGTETPIRLVRSAVVYGPNAGGKSNLLSALSFLKRFIMDSARESQLGDKISIDSFRFDPITHTQPSEFEVTFISDEIRYQYGFSVIKTQVIEEWLFAYPSGRPQQWFSRVYIEDNNDYNWKFSKHFKVSKQVVKLTRKNSLLLSSAVNLNNTQLLPVFNWFRGNLIVIPIRNSVGINAASLEYVCNKINKQKIIHFLQPVDSSIIDISSEDKKNSEINKIHITHKGGIHLNFSEESEGTRRLFSFAGYWLNALENGNTLIVDELDNSIHALVVKYLIDLIHDPKINKHNAQLIFSTHETALLSTDNFRRDQVWFVEKDPENSTQLYPLTDFSPRKNEAIEKGYLQGRYGALPYIGDFE